MTLCRPSEVNSRALVAVQSTTMGLRDFRLVRALLHLPVPGHNLSTRTLKSLTSCTSQVSQESMFQAAAEVRSRDNAVPLYIPGALKFDVSFDATWYRKATRVIKVSEQPLMLLATKYLIISCTNACAENSYLGHKKYVVPARGI